MTPPPRGVTAAASAQVAALGLEKSCWLGVRHTEMR